jgi:hypothetical protein
VGSPKRGFQTESQLPPDQFFDRHGEDVSRAYNQHTYHTGHREWKISCDGTSPVCCKSNQTML